MYIYSEVTKEFLERVRGHVRKILTLEMELVYQKSRVLFKGVTYPLGLAVFEGESQLAYYRPAFYELGLNKRLIYSAKEHELINILRHELAHFHLHILGEGETPHDAIFKSYCRSRGWDEEVLLASQNLLLSNEKVEGELEFEKLFERIKKLLSLASSSNVHEAELATVKANQLLLRYNINKIKEPRDESYMERVYQAKRPSGKLHAIYEILQTFYVYPVINRGRGEVVLEVVGSRGNIDLASYVATFLDRHLDLMWESHQKEHHELKGLAAKNSFFLGVSRGYKSKIESALLETPDEKSFIPVLKEQLKEDVARVYNRLQKYSTTQKDNQLSRTLGERAGKALSIHPSLKSNLFKKIFLIK